MNSVILELPFTGTDSSRVNSQLVVEMFLKQKQPRSNNHDPTFLSLPLSPSPVNSILFSIFALICSARLVLDGIFLLILLSSTTTARRRQRYTHMLARPPSQVITVDLWTLEWWNNTMLGHWGLGATISSRLYSRALLSHKCTYFISKSQKERQSVGQYKEAGDILKVVCGGQRNMLVISVCIHVCLCI